MKLPKRPLLAYWLLALSLWLVLGLAFAAWGFLVPHPPHFAPEIGITAAFVFFGAIYSAIYWALVFVLGAIWHGISSYLLPGRT